MASTPSAEFSPPDWRRWLSGTHLTSLLDALAGNPAVGWVLKSTPSLQYVQWSGALPMADPLVSRSASALPEAAVALQAGQTDALHFDPTQASILRLADLRALRQGTPQTEVHRIETRHEDDTWSALDWRAWRLVVKSPESATTCLLVVWLDLGMAERAEERLAQAHRQIQAQQLLIAQLRAQVPDESALAASEASLTWAAQRFAQQLRREIDLSRREQRSFALILLAIGPQTASPATTGDSALGETASHTTGDQAISALLGRVLAQGTRAMDTVAQIAPRRFGIILSGAQLTPAYARAEALRRQAAAQVVVESGAAAAVALFIGVAAYPLTTDQPDALMAAAEAALQEALAQGPGPTDGAGRSVLARVALSSPDPG